MEPNLHPIDARDVTKTFEDAQDRLVLQASDLSLETVAAMVDQQAIDLAPEFQRRERWGVRQQSALIESFLLNIPVPPVYLSEEDFGRYSVIDGKQRISAIHGFMRAEFALTGLSRFDIVEGAKFDGLPPALRNALQVRPYIRAVTLLRQSDEEIKYEVFHRLNSGGEPLNSQEIRNVIFRGSLNDSIMKLAKNQFLRDRLKIRDDRSPAYRVMSDAEYVLRFLTLREGWKDFSGDFREAMDGFMAKNRKVAGKSLNELEAAFGAAIENCEKLWGQYAFRRFDRGGWRDQFLGGMYDAQMIAVDFFDQEVIEKLMTKRKILIEKTQDLFDDDRFDASVRTSTNTTSRVVYRIAQVINLMSKLTDK